MFHPDDGGVGAAAICCPNSKKSGVLELANAAFPFIGVLRTPSPESCYGVRVRITVRVSFGSVGVVDSFLVVLCIIVVRMLRRGLPACSKF